MSHANNAHCVSSAYSNPCQCWSAVEKFGRAMPQLVAWRPWENSGAGTVPPAWWQFLGLGCSLINEINQQLLQVPFESQRDEFCTQASPTLECSLSLVGFFIFQWHLTLVFHIISSVVHLVCRCSVSWGEAARRGGREQVGDQSSLDSHVVACGWRWLPQCSWFFSISLKNAHMFKRNEMTGLNMQLYGIQKEIGLSHYLNILHDERDFDVRYLIFLWGQVSCCKRLKMPCHKSNPFIFLLVYSFFFPDCQSLIWVEGRASE